MKSAPQIRPIQTSDIEAVRAMHYLHMSPAAKEDYLKVNAAAAARTERILSGQQGICLVAELENEVIGYLIGEPTSSPLTTIQYATLETIFVLPDHRRHGVGSALIVSFRIWAKSTGAARLAVDVSPRNQAAIEFYRHHGFAPATLTMEYTID